MWGTYHLKFGGTYHLTMLNGAKFFAGRVDLQIKTDAVSFP